MTGKPPCSTIKTAVQRRFHHHMCASVHDPSWAAVGTADALLNELDLIGQYIMVVGVSTAPVNSFAGYAHPCRDYPGLSSFPRPEQCNDG